MKVKDVLITNVITIPLGATHEEAARLLSAHNISGAPVVDEHGTLVGVLSEKDLFRGLYPSYQKFFDDPHFYMDYEAREDSVEEIHAKPVSKFMRSNVISVTSDTPILRAGAIMLAKNVARLPVVNDGKLVGIVTRDQIYEAVLRKHLGF
jgi:CBS domain-containing protein